MVGNLTSTSIKRSVAGEAMSRTWVAAKNHAMHGAYHAEGGAPDLSAWTESEKRFKGSLPEVAAQRIRDAYTSQRYALSLTNLSLHSLPKEIAQLRHLHILCAGGNNFTEVPKELGKLGLHALCLSKNRLQRLPDSLDSAHCMVLLDVRFNELVDLPRNLKSRDALIIRAQGNRFYFWQRLPTCLRGVWRRGKSSVARWSRGSWHRYLPSP